MRSGSMLQAVVTLIWGNHVVLLAGVFVSKQARVQPSAVFRSQVITPP